MKAFPALLLAGGLFLTGPAFPAPSDPPSAKPGRGALDSSAITEFTDAGRKAAQPTADRPVYVVAQPGGQHDFGQAQAGDKPLAPEALVPVVEQAVQERGYAKAEAGNRPTILLVFNWGLHSPLGEDYVDPGYRNLLDRAALIGGQKFAGELKVVLQKEVNATAGTSTQPWGASMPGMTANSAASLLRPISAMEVFRRRSVRNEWLLSQINDQCYYVVVSAFDYSSVLRGEKQLLWRTKLSTNTRGTSMAAAIPTLIREGAEYYGQDMTDAALFKSSRAATHP